MCKEVEDMLEKVKKDTEIRIAKSLLNDKTLSLEKIAEYTGLTLLDVENLKTNNQGERTP